MPSTHTPVHPKLVAVCVITYKRPRGLERLLEGLNRLTFSGNPPEVTCIVVDNDAAETAREVYDAGRSTSRWNLEYATEPRRGIPFARNTALRKVPKEADFVAFIDDDEVPEPNWLDELLRVQRDYGADVVGGPVVPFFEQDPPSWITKGGFHDRPHRATGQRLQEAFTGNILFRSEVLAAMDGHFDERMAATGGSDSHLLRRVHRAGFVIVWAADAVAVEWVPPSRFQVSWILRRAYRYGCTTSFIYRDFHSLPVSVAVLSVLGCYRIARGLIVLPVALLIGRHKVVACIRHLYYGIGLLVGLAGGRYEEYRNTHGD